MKNKGVLYLNIASKIKQNILEGKYPVGTFIPTENELEKMFDVSKITVRKAIELLASEGYVEKKSGKGTTVISNRLFNKLSKAASFSTILDEEGLSLTKKVVSVKEVSLAKKDIRFEYFGENCIEITRQYYLDDKPYVYFLHSLPVRKSFLKIDNENHQSLYQVMTEEKLIIDSIKDDFKAVIVPETVQKFLQTQDKLAIKRRRLSFDDHGTVIEFSEAFYASEIHPYTIEYEV